MKANNKENARKRLSAKLRSQGRQLAATLRQLRNLMDDGAYAVLHTENYDDCSVIITGNCDKGFRVVGRDKQ